MENIRSAIEEYLAAINDLLQDIPNANAIPMGGIVRDANLTNEEFRRLLQRPSLRQ